MLTSFKNSLILLTIFLTGFVSNFSSPAHAEDFRSLMKQETRPSVTQVMDWLATNPKLKRLRYVKEFQPDPSRARPDLQYNYKVWFPLLTEGTPAMIACFEKAFPGATWAFIGRDTASLADVFESFYRYIGQEDRVLRIGMSKASLEGMTHDLMQSFLKKLGLDLDDLSNLRHPLIFVDTVSHGGGTQARWLINAAYSYHQQTNGRDAREIVPYINFIGLQGATTAIPFRDACSASRLIHDPGYWDHPKAFGTEHMLTYTDGKTGYERTTEASYSHWVGAWHGPYGKMTKLSDGTLVGPDPGPQEPYQHRAEILNFQGHIVKTVQTIDFLQKVRSEAKKLGYAFPERRPKYIPNPEEYFSKQLNKASKLANITRQLSEFERYNLGRISIQSIIPSLKEALTRSLSKPTEKPILESRRLRSIFSRPELKTLEAELPKLISENHSN